MTQERIFLFFFFFFFFLSLMQMGLGQSKSRKKWNYIDHGDICGCCLGLILLLKMHASRRIVEIHFGITARRLHGSCTIEYTLSWHFADEIGRRHIQDRTNISQLGIQVMCQARNLEKVMDIS
jgi:hypothetical protein